MTKPQPGVHTASQSSPSNVARSRANIIGIWGLSSAGYDSFNAELYKTQLDKIRLTFYKGLEVLGDEIPSPHSAFLALPMGEKQSWCRKAIGRIVEECSTNQTTAVVTGLPTFWPTEENESDTSSDPAGQTHYTHIIYVDDQRDEAHLMADWDLDDGPAPSTTEELRAWKSRNITRLREMCLQRRILFSVVEYQNMLFPRKVARLLENLDQHSEATNTRNAEHALDAVLAATGAVTAKEVYVFGGDHTLTSQDSNSILLEVFGDRVSRLKSTFDNLPGHSYFALRQAALLYTEISLDWTSRCEEAGKKVHIAAGFLSFLRRLRFPKHCAALILTCGPQAVWQNALRKAGLSEKVMVLGGGTLDHGYVMTPATKEAVVNQLRNSGKTVFAIGGSPTDIGMLMQAEHAVVVAGEDPLERNAFLSPLLDAVNESDWRAGQLVRSDKAAPLIKDHRLPLISFEDLEAGVKSLKHVIVTDKSLNISRLLTTSIQSARGSVMRDNYRRLGWYLALEHASKILGVERHGPASERTDFHISRQAQTLILPIGRESDTMALGVADVLDSAAFTPIDNSSHIQPRHLKDKPVAVLVATEIASNSSIFSFIEKLHKLKPNIRIVIIANVVQQEALADLGPLQEWAVAINLSLVAVSTSTTQTATDTGHRMFNTRHGIQP